VARSGGLAHTQTDYNRHDVHTDNHCAKGKQRAISEGEGAGTKHEISLSSEVLLEVRDDGKISHVARKRQVQPAPPYRL
jgi:hypothetical protein